MPRMKAPENCSGLGHGETKYTVDRTGHSEIATEHVELAKRHGFTLVAEKAPAFDFEEDEAPKSKKAR